MSDHYPIQDDIYGLTDDQKQVIYIGKTTVSAMLAKILVDIDATPDLLLLIQQKLRAVLIR